MKKILFLLSFLIFGALSYTNAQSDTKDSDWIRGTWLNADKDAHIRIYRAKNGKYYGKIEWLKRSSNADGTPRTDEHNPDESMRSNPLLGTMIVKGFEYDADDKEWENGEVYDSKSGNTYEGYMKENEDGSLYLKGYMMGMRWLGRSSNWTRVE